jgi:hypothetical protein
VLDTPDQGTHTQTLGFGRGARKYKAHNGGTRVAKSSHRQPG